ncbi:MAG TPA: ABC transporter substrate-binding protein [Candidatus Binatia bacterium]|jgi:putative ABC transport system substrate-binding protein|nr:ABC transporter substrate-binding protein [Candidatus Binatia bacterium]HEV8724352.1 ABC transporter substrate-binding protein [Candidatus Binatia bacterium]
MQKAKVNREIVICLLTTALLSTVPLVEAQQPRKISRLGVIRPERPGDSGGQALVDAFREGLRELGYVEGQNVALEIRWAEGKRDRLFDLAVELVRLRVDCIITGGFTATQAAKKATSTIPIVMAHASDPVRDGLVASLSRPGGNITGLSHMATELSGKRLEIVKEAVPKVSRVAVLLNTTNPMQALNFKEAEAASLILGVTLNPLEVREANDFEGAFQAAVRGRADALLAFADAFFNTHRKRIVDLATKNRLPAMYTEPEYIDAGGLMVYGPSISDLYRRAAIYVDKILKGVKPGELPVERPTKFDLIINLKAAKQIGLTIPPNVLARADRVIK